MNESIAKFVGGLIGVGGHFYWYAARGFKKVPDIYRDFDFFSQKTPDFEN